MLQTFYGSYTKILMIFGSIQNLLFEFKYQTLLNKKEKEKKTSHAAGPLGLGPRWLERSLRADGARGPLPLRGH
jgi:hypothetical protein